MVVEPVERLQESEYPVVDRQLVGCLHRLQLEVSPGDFAEQGVVKLGNSKGSAGYPPPDVLRVLPGKTSPYGRNGFAGSFSPTKVSQNVA